MNEVRGCRKGAALLANAVLSIAYSTSAAAQDGGLDPAFGDGGIVEIPWPAGYAQGNAVAIDSANRIIVGGYATGPTLDIDFALLRLTSTGSLDASFAPDNAGFRLIDFDLAGIGGPSDDFVNDIAIVAGDGVAAVGEAHFSLYNSQFAVAGVDADGTPDPAFGNSGTAHFGFDTFSNSDHATIAHVDGSGRLVVAGNVNEYVTDVTYQVGTARLTPTGLIDATFPMLDTVIWADTSTMPVTKPRYSIPTALVLDSNERVVTCGYYFDPFAQDTAVFRGTVDGGYDPAFGSAGNGRITLGLANSSCGGISVLGNGKLMISGTYGTERADSAFLVRLNDAGDIDPAFGSSGVASTVAVDADHYAQFNFLAPTKDGGWLLAGAYGKIEVNVNPIVGVIIARFTADGQPDPRFGVGGVATIEPDPVRHFSAQHAALQPDGMLVVAGSFLNAANDGTNHFAVLRIRADYDTLFVAGFEAAP